MKHIVILLLLCTVNCRPQDNKKIENTAENTEKKQPRDTKELFYAISLQIDIPFELYLNDIPLAKEYAMSRKVMGIDINPYLLSNGSHRLKARFLAPTDGSGETVSNNDLKNSFLKLVSYEKQTEPDMGRVKNYKVLQELPLTIPNIKIPMIEQEWNIEITDLPYELEGWRNSQDLRLMDREELEKEVFGFFEEIKDKLHNGDVEGYLEMNENKDAEIRICTYDEDNLNWYSSSERKNELLNDCQGNMWPINPKDYVMKIYANGKLATIERVEKFKGECLIAETDTDYWYYNFFIHKPIGKDEFEIIRK
ncbi:hypothetical protein [Zobellia galactanivorans]|uniref:hypothetical protein n=1 Tax=Zobellia galactanivorans (strain DSM 12802 / CCUG 47099 / CIP 106680 / NCIMB 13871 / Dsij) TaxID=63186 RepID=UPI001C07EE32|nr:hypothetical protein [Zobellia galactanivorans]MBU3026008.1 hypothetical protein [Zobellia galactanivorans]